MLGMTTQEKLLKFNNNKYFLKEFTFSDTKFVPDNETEIELADSIIFTKDFSLIFQAKERNEINKGEDIKWFNSTVLKKAKDQIKKTYKNLERLKLVDVENDIGLNASLKRSILDHAVAVIIHSKIDIPSSESKNFIISQSIGFIHVLNLEEYCIIIEQLIMPTDIYMYFQNRKKSLEGKYFNNESDCLINYMEQSVREFIKEQPSYFIQKIGDSKYDVNYAVSVLRDELNIANQSTAKGSQDDYLDYLDYRSLLQYLALLDWLEMKQFLIILDSIEFYIESDISSKPYRIVNERLNCGFVITYIDTQNRNRWYNIMNTFMKFHCFEFNLGYCIGIAYTKDDEGSTRKEMIFDVRGENGDVTEINNYEMIKKNIRSSIIQKRKY